jgi:hypothetical protein
MFNLKVTGTTFHGEAQVISSGRGAAVVHVNAEQVWSAEELRKSRPCSNPQRGSWRRETRRRDRRSYRSARFISGEKSERVAD